MCGPPQKYIDQFAKKMGEAAALSGRGPHECLFKGSERHAWMKGYNDVKNSAALRREAEVQKEGSARN